MFRVSRMSLRCKKMISANNKRHFVLNFSHDSMLVSCYVFRL